MSENFLFYITNLLFIYFGIDLLNESERKKNGSNLIAIFGGRNTILDIYLNFIGEVLFLILGIISLL